MKVFIYSIILLFVTILLLTKSLPLKAKVFFRLVEICSLYLEVIISSLRIGICIVSSE